MKIVEYNREIIVKEGLKNGSPTIYRLTVKDATGTLDANQVDSLFVAFQNNFLDLSLDEHFKNPKKWNISKKIEGTQATLEISKRTLWKRKK
jgi:hypothetical protein